MRVIRENCFKVYLLCFIFMGLEACKTKVSAGGIIYSRNHIPVEGATVQFNYGYGQKSQVQGAIYTLTDKEGRFAFDKKSTGHPKAWIESIDVFHNDSGAVHIERSKFQLSSDMEIQLR